ncbi:hypothetical protein QRD43_01465 [Pelomonas sp. APW6]|uniref:Uncharacterized protein n=1 Tax=Roseateles subflavus TaxID=3053353 RepID=A0ABT7LCH0_9BURK|nr:hypothetical protein [Pelomonas sp. APW6]MDL5030560.1 hypothetical protein [Pelomonas sp. APW6]
MPLPTEAQRQRLCDLMAAAFIELRYLEGEQAHDLAYAFHNLPKEMYGWGAWNLDTVRARLQRYQDKHAERPGFPYVAAFNDLFPPAA